MDDAQAAQAILLGRAKEGRQLLPRFFAPQAVQVQFALDGPVALAQLAGHVDADAGPAKAQRIVYVQQDGEYVPKEVHTGIQGELYTQVLDGLQANTPVVTFGSFFIDAEHKLKGTGLNQ